MGRWGDGEMGNGGWGSVGSLGERELMLLPLLLPPTPPHLPILFPCPMPNPKSKI